MKLKMWSLILLDNWAWFDSLHMQIMKPRSWNCKFPGYMLRPNKKLIQIIPFGVKKKIWWCKVLCSFSFFVLTNWQTLTCYRGVSIVSDMHNQIQSIKKKSISLKSLWIFLFEMTTSSGMIAHGNNHLRVKCLYNRLYMPYVHYSEIGVIECVQVWFVVICCKNNNNWFQVYSLCWSVTLWFNVFIVMEDPLICMVCFIGNRTQQAWEPSNFSVDRVFGMIFSYG